MSAAVQPGEESPAEEGAATDAGEPPQLPGRLGAALHVLDRANLVRRACIRTLHAIEQELPGVEAAVRVEREKLCSLELQAGSMHVMDPAAMGQLQEKVREELEDLERDIGRKKWQRDVLRGIWVLWFKTLCMEGDCRGVQLQLRGLQGSVQQLARLVRRQVFLQQDAAQMAFYQDASGVLKQMTELLLAGRTDSTPPRILLYGPPGMGKSCAAVRIFEMWQEDAELQVRYPDGPRLVIFGNNTDSSTGKRFLLSRLRKLQFALESASTALQMPEVGMATPRTGEGQNSDDTSGVLAEVAAAKQAVRGLLQGKSYLLIVDDVWPGEAEVLEHAGCFPARFRGACIVTSRWNLADNFPAATATVPMHNERPVCEAILAAYAYRSREEKRLRQEHQAVGQELLDRCGDSALTLRLVGSSLASRQNWDTVLERLPKLIRASKQTHNTDMAKRAFALSLQWVAEDDGVPAEGMRSMLAALQQLPAVTQVPVDVVRVVWRMHCDGCDDDTFEDILLRLIDASVVDQKQHDLIPSAYTISFHALLLESLAATPPTGEPTPQAPRLSSLSATDPSPYLMGLCCVRLFGSPTSSAAAAARLSELPVVEGSWPCAWWQNCSSRDRRPDALGALLHLAEEHPVLGQVLVSAAVGRLWPALTDQLPALLKRRDTAVVALALLVGASASDRLPWRAEYSAALKALADTASTASDAALLVRVGQSVGEFGDWDAALAVSRSTLRIRTDVYGERDARTLDTRSDVAVCLGNSGQYVAAVEQLEGLLSIQTDTLGAHHVDTLTTVNMLSDNLGRCGRYRESLARAEEALAGRSRVLGPDHQSTLKSMRQVAWAQHRLGDNEAALKTFQEVARLRARVLGPDHPESLESAAQMGVGWDGVGKHEKALEAKEAALPGHQRVLGPRHPWTTTLICNIAVSLAELGRLEEALQRDREVLQLLREAHGERHVDVLDSMRRITSRLLQLGKDEEALLLGQQALELHKQELGERHMQTLELVKLVDFCKARLGQG